MAGADNNNPDVATTSHPLPFGSRTVGTEPPVSGLEQGTVVEFDEALGYGVVATSSGVQRWFHCASIADGSRAVSLGAAEFREKRGHGGRVEAVELRGR